MLKFICLIAVLFLASCAYNQQYNTVIGDGFIFCSGSVDKPVSVETPLQATVPMGGSSAISPTQTNTLPGIPAK